LHSGRPLRQKLIPKRRETVGVELPPAELSGFIDNHDCAIWQIASLQTFGNCRRSRQTVAI
jgi:hypothetical protein